jgi:hypothetical protein
LSELSCNSDDAISAGIKATRALLMADECPLRTFSDLEPRQLHPKTYCPASKLVTVCLSLWYSVAVSTSRIGWL